MLWWRPSYPYLAMCHIAIHVEHVINVILEVESFSLSNKVLRSITSCNKSYPDTILLYLSNNNIIYGAYIPPNDSSYFSDQFEQLEAVTRQNNNCKLLIVGDLNSRLGDLRIMNKFSYTNNPDSITNRHGQKLINLIQKHNLIPINHLTALNRTFDGGFTFKRGDHKSQIDWAIVNISAKKYVKSFKILSNFPNVSDHFPITIDYHIDLSIPLSTTYDNICDIMKEKNNHSYRKNYTPENVNTEAFTALCTSYLNEFRNASNNGSNNEISKRIDDILYKSAKGSSKKVCYTQETHVSGNDYEGMKHEINEIERKRWKDVMANGDNKKLWNQINWNGDLTSCVSRPEHKLNEFAHVLENRSSCQGEDAFNDIRTNIFNPTLDARITTEEVKSAAEKMKRNSKSNTGISVNLLLLILNKFLFIITTLFNNIFIGNYDKYPSNWISAIKCIAKKGQLSILTFRGIAMKEILAKLYDSILMARLQKWLLIPHEQTAYQKGKGCSMHVFFVRSLTAIASKTKKSLFIGVTDFSAAFDTINRRLLFVKLSKLGIGMFMLNALKDMYTNTLAYVSIQGEYSDLFPLKAGVLQGSATSTLLFMAYTSDIITIFTTLFAKELYIHMYHLLLHADDSLILASTKELLIKKYLAMDNYCLKNMLHLQAKKCGFICINSDEKDCIILRNGVVNHLNEISYLGSIISSYGNVTRDIKLEVDSKVKHFNKFYAFLYKNFNAPMSVKTKVLESCVCSALLYNCETWGNASINNLEKKYIAALKYMLGVRKQTCNEFPFVELGLLSLKTSIMRRQYRFYQNIINKKDWPLLRHIVCQSRDVGTNFIKHYDKLIEEYQNEEEIIIQAVQKQKAVIIEKARAGKTRYLTYLKINPNLEKARIYERNNTSMAKLQEVAKIRTVSHRLMIEVGRHGRNRKPIDERLCHCGEVESEEHFLLRCVTYEHIRKRYNINTALLLSDVLDSNNIERYINDLYEIRTLYTDL